MSTIAPFGAAATSTIGIWVVECIIMAGSGAILDDRWYDTRLLVLGSFNGASVCEIQRAAHRSHSLGTLGCLVGHQTRSYREESEGGLKSCTDLSTQDYSLSLEVVKLWCPVRALKWYVDRA